jgi:MFS family permease
VAESPSPAARASAPRLGLTHWLILGIAAIGFLFDIYELLMLPLVLPGALRELLPGVTPGAPEFNFWRACLFWFPALTGGLFGLLGGYLTDLWGRRRVLTGSILLYALSAFLSGFVTSMPLLLVLRCTTFIGVCVEFVAAVAWLAELFPVAAQRERALGYTQAFSSFGGLLVGGAFLLANRWAEHLPAITLPAFLEKSLGFIPNPHAPWRYTLMSGLIPALPLVFIRPFLPESPVWQRKKQAGTLKRPSLRELFTPGLAQTTIVTTLLVACSYGAAFGAIQQLPQIVPALPEVRAEVMAATAAAAPKLNQLPPPEQAQRQRQLVSQIQGRTAGQLQIAQEIGGLVGRFLLALLVVRILSRRTLLRLFQVPGLLLVPLVFAYVPLHNQILFSLGDWHITWLHLGIFAVGLLTVAQFSFWGNYLPLVYPLHLRGTGESVAANIGGRMLGTSFAAVTSLVSGLPFVPGADDATRMAYTAAGVGLFVYLAGFLLSYFLPEPQESTLQE